MSNNDQTLDLLEETRFKKKHSEFIKRMTLKTHFTEIELESLLIIYYKIQKDGQDKQVGITKDQFRDILHCAFDMLDENLTERIFTALERGQFHPNIVSMETWCHTMSLFLRGNLEEKIHHCFSVYDIMGDGMIGRDTMFNLLKSALIMQGGDDEAEESIKVLQKVNIYFAKKRHTNLNYQALCR